MTTQADDIILTNDVEAFRQGVAFERTRLAIRMRAQRDSMLRRELGEPTGMPAIVTLALAGLLTELSDQLGNDY